MNIVKGEDASFIINTNRVKKNDFTDENDMLLNQKCATYGSKNSVIASIPAGSKVYLYSNGIGIIAKGIATGNVLKKPRFGKEDDEYYMPLDQFSKLDTPITYEELTQFAGRRIPVYIRLIQLDTIFH
jgi:hypothetical protein